MVEEAAGRGWPITVSGGRTGIVAGAVPEGGLVISLERMNRVLGMGRTDDGTVTVRCQAGVTLQELQTALGQGSFADSSDWDEESRRILAQLRHEPCFFPPDPTETSASLGGVVACNASGAHSFGYGPTRNYIQGLSVVLADGGLLQLSRGQVVAGEGGSFARTYDDGQSRRLRPPRYRLPQTKNAAGYFSASRLDLIDLLVGSEGTLGIIAEVELRLRRQPPFSSAAMIFLPAEAAALELVGKLRRSRHETGLVAVEYFDCHSLNFLREHRRQLGATSGVPECLPEVADCALYLDLTAAAEELPRTLETVRREALSEGADPALCWSAHENDERERLRLFRHALPEAINQRIAAVRRRYPEVTKLGTDMAVPDDRLADMVRLYRQSLQRAGLCGLTFGHIGDNHLHVNILPENPEEYQRGRKLYLELAREVVAMGGTPAAEHGIGKLKKDFLELLVGARGLSEMRRVKEFFDPDFRLGQGTLLE